MMLSVGRTFQRISVWRNLQLKVHFSEARSTDPQASSDHQQPKKQKSYVMPQEPADVRYKPKIPLVYNEGRALIYLNKQRLSTPSLLTAHLTIPMIYLAYLIKVNPCKFVIMMIVYLTFPAALPIMGIIEMILFMRYITHKKDHKFQIERVYIGEKGVGLEVYLANKIRRKLKNTDQLLIWPVKNMESPPDGPNQLPKKIPLFPQTLGKRSEIQTPQPWHYGWYKYDQDRVNYIFPKNYEYANWEVLTAVMRGIQINTQDCIFQSPIPPDEQRKIPTLEDGLAQVEKRLKFQEEWVEKHGPVEFGIRSGK